MAQKTPDILKKIVARKHEEIAESIKRLPIERMIELANSADTPEDFSTALNKKVKSVKVELLLKLKKPLQAKAS